MGMPIRSERAEVVRSRVHNDRGTSARALVKSTAAVADLVPRPRLSVVPRRRRTARLVAVGSAVVFGLMLGAAAFQTQVASRQLDLDVLDRRIRAAHESYDILRRERAELRSPGRLAREASALGMVPATQTEFVSIDPDVIATVERSGAPGGDTSAPTVAQEFEQYATVKSQAGGMP